MKPRTCHEKLLDSILESGGEEETPRCVNSECRLNDDRFIGSCLAMEIKLGESLPRTLENIGDKYGVCRMRICQIEKKAREKIMDLHSLASRGDETVSRVT